MNNISCIMCKEELGTVTMYLNHLKSEHAFVGPCHIRAKCGFQSCTEYLKDRKSLKTHMMQCAKKNKPDVISTSTQPQNEQPSSSQSRTQFHEAEKEVVLSQLDDFIHNVHELTHLNVVLNMIFKFLLLIFSKLLNLFKDILLSGRPDALQFITSLETSLVEKIKNYSTSYKRKIIAFKNVPTPKDIIIQNAQKANKNATITFISIEETIKFIMSIDKIQMCRNFFERKCEENFIQYLEDGNFYKQNFSNSRFKNLIQIILYSDDFQTVNPLGAKVHHNKVTGVYFTLRNLPPELSSKINYIYLTLLFRSNLSKDVSLSDIYKPVIDEIKKIEEKGIEILWNGEKKVFPAALVSVAGDNLGLNQMFGMQMNFSNDNFCRMCYASIDDIQSKFQESDFVLRTRESYAKDLDNLMALGTKKKIVNGIKEPSIFHELQYFNIIDAPSVDIMHDLLEGVVQYDLHLFFKFLMDHKYYTLRKINEKILSFNYGCTEAHNFPSEIKLKPKVGKIGQKAGQMWTLINFIPLIFYNEFNNQIDEKLKSICHFIILIIQITKIVFSEKISKHHVELLNHLILQHHTILKNIFPTFNYKAKYHFMVHYVNVILKLGPLKKIWCMRFESKHALLKTIACTSRNFINITKTLAEKHQEQMHHKYMNEETKKEYVLSQKNKDDNLTEILQILKDENNEILFIDKLYDYENFTRGAFFFHNQSFHRINNIFTFKSKIYFYCSVYNINFYDNNVQAFNVFYSEGKVIIEMSKILNTFTFSLTMINDQAYIVSKIILYE